MRGWLVLTMLVGVMAYSGFSLLWQHLIVWILTPFLVLASLVMIHKGAQRPRVDGPAVFGIIMTPLVLSIGLIARVGPIGIPLVLAMYLLPGLALFAGYYAALRWERAEPSSSA